MSPFRVTGIDHVELFVPDRRVAAEWYGRELGFEVMRDYEYWADDPRGPLMISPDNGRTKLALFEGPPAGRAAAEVGMRSIAFATDSPGFLGSSRDLIRWSSTTPAAPASRRTASSITTPRSRSTSPIRGARRWS